MITFAFFMYMHDWHAIPQTCSNAVTAECCDEPSEDCSSGEPATCNAGCATVVVPVHDRCLDYLNSQPYMLSVLNLLSNAVATCDAKYPGSGH